MRADRVSVVPGLNQDEYLFTLYSRASGSSVCVIINGQTAIDAAAALLQQFDGRDDAAPEPGIAAGNDEIAAD